MSQTAPDGPSSDRVTTRDWFFRGLVVVNLTLLVLIFVPTFSGIGSNAPGLADRVGGKIRLAGWRADVVWVCVSTMCILLAAVGPASERGISRLTSVLCRLWIGCFVVYGSYVLLHMFG